MKVWTALKTVAVGVALASVNLVGVAQSDFAKPEETMPVCTVVLSYETNLNPCANLDASQVEDMRNPNNTPVIIIYTGPDQGSWDHEERHDEIERGR